MKKEELKNRNIWKVVLGVFFGSFSVSLASFFLPYFLQEKGLSALQIGGLFTGSIAIGALIFNVFFSRALRKIKLRTGLVFAGVLNFLETFVLYLFPSYFGIVGNKIFHETYNPISQISIDTSIQHNVEKRKERKTSALWTASSTFGILLGIILSLILIPMIGFRNSFLIFSIISLPSLFFYSRVREETRFKLKKEFKLPKISGKLKLILSAEILYWFAKASSAALVITFLVSDKLSGTLFDLGLLFIALYITLNLTIYFTKERLDKFNETKTAIFGMSFLLASAVLIILTKNFWIVFSAFVLEGVGAGIWVPSKTALQWKNTQKENREKISGWLSGLKSFVQGIGPLVGGFLITAIGINSPFYFRAGICIISIGIYFYILKKD